jgi:hypothetical protein
VCQKNLNGFEVTSTVLAFQIPVGPHRSLTFQDAKPPTFRAFAVVKNFTVVYLSQGPPAAAAKAHGVRVFGVAMGACFRGYAHFIELLFVGVFFWPGGLFDRLAGRGLEGKADRAAGLDGDTQAGLIP